MKTKEEKLKNGQLVAKATKNCNIFQSWIIANSQSARFLSTWQAGTHFLMTTMRCTYDMFAKTIEYSKATKKNPTSKQATITFSDDDDIIIIWHLRKNKNLGPVCHDWSKIVLISK